MSSNIYDLKLHESLKLDRLGKECIVTKVPDGWLYNDTFVKYSKPVKKRPILNPSFDFYKSFLDLGVEPTYLRDWILVRQKKKATNSETSFNSLSKEMSESSLSISEAVKVCAEMSWSGFKDSWISKGITNKNETMQERIERLKAEARQY